MAKNPVLPLYYNDISTSTQDWTDEEFGAYMRLLIHQWRQGGLPNDYQRLTRIATSLDTNWSMLKSKFVEVDGLLKNLVMEDIRAKKLKHSEKQSNNVRKRYQKSTKDNTKNLPLEEEIEIEEEIERKEVQEENIYEADFADYERWTNDVITGNDHLFESMLMKESIKPKDQLPSLANGYLALLAQYPKKAPPDQHRFRIALMNHIREKFTTNDRKTNPATSRGIRPKEFGNANYTGSLRGSRTNGGGDSGGSAKGAGREA